MTMKTLALELNELQSTKIKALPQLSLTLQALILPILATSYR